MPDTNPYQVDEFWYWYDETSNIYGPYETEQAAAAELHRYAKEVLGDSAFNEVFGESSET